MEETVGASGDGFVAIHPTRANDANGWLLLFHSAHLHRTGVATQNNVALHILFVGINKEGVLHIACRVVGSKIQRAKHVPIVFHFRTICQGETKARKNVDNLFTHQRNGMTCAQCLWHSRASDIYFVGFFSLCLKALTQFVQLFREERFQFVQLLTEFFLLLCRHISKFIEKSGHFALFTQIFNS